MNHVKASPLMTSEPFLNVKMLTSLLCLVNQDIAKKKLISLGPTRREPRIGLFEDRVDEITLRVLLV